MDNSYKKHIFWITVLVILVICSAGLCNAPVDQILTWVAAAGKFLLLWVGITWVVVQIYVWRKTYKDSKGGRDLQNKLRLKFARLRKPQIVVEEFENLSGESAEHLGKMVRLRMTEKLQQFQEPAGQLELLAMKHDHLITKDLSDQKAPIYPEVIDDIKNLVDDLAKTIERTEFKILVFIIRWLFPTPGLRISGSLLKTNRYGLQVKISNLVTAEIYQSRTIWCKTGPTEPQPDSLTPSPDNPIQPAKTPNIADKPEDPPTWITAIQEALFGTKKEPDATVSKQPETCSAQTYYNLTTGTALWAGRYLLVAHMLSLDSPLAPITQISTEKKKAQLLNRLGYLFSRQGYYAEATMMFETATKKEEPWYIPYKNLADVYSFQGLQKKSIKEYDKALTKRITESVKKNIEISQACSRWLTEDEQEREAAKNTAQSVHDWISEFEEDNTLKTAMAELRYTLACFYALASSDKPSNKEYISEAINLLKKAKEDLSDIADTVYQDPDLKTIRNTKEFKDAFKPDPTT